MNNESLATKTPHELEVTFTCNRINDSRIDAIAEQRLMDLRNAGLIPEVVKMSIDQIEKRMRECGMLVPAERAAEERRKTENQRLSYLRLWSTYLDKRKKLEEEKHE